MQNKQWVANAFLQLGPFLQTNHLCNHHSVNVPDPLN